MVTSVSEGGIPVGRTEAELIQETGRQRKLEEGEKSLSRQWIWEPKVDASKG